VTTLPPCAVTVFIVVLTLLAIERVPGAAAVIYRVAALALHTRHLPPIRCGLDQAFPVKMTLNQGTREKLVRVTHALLLNLKGDVHSILLADFHHSEVDILLGPWDAELQQEEGGGGDHGVVFRVPIPVESVADGEVGVALLHSDEAGLQIELSEVDVKFERVPSYSRPRKCEVVQNPATSERKS